ncbi:hypothetical protein C8J56DRAFT_886695 [Mycena floridula]|nr:hypothetical protein C8J56DRAFT_886695 [Mycena floridula]
MANAKPTLSLANAERSFLAVSRLRTEAMHTPLHAQTPAMKTLIESGWKEPARFSSSFKRAKKQKPTVDVLPVMRFQSPAPKTPNPRVDQTAKQLGVISFSGLPPFVDGASESTSPAPMTIVMPEPLTETGGDSNSDDADMVPIEDIIDTETLCTGEEEEEASFADAPEGDADDVMMAVVTT